MWRALKSGYGYFPRVKEGYRTIWRKKKFFGKFFPKGDHCSFWHFPLDSTEDQIFFPKSFFYTLVMWRALESGYGYFPRGREGYRSIWRKKKFFGKFFPKWVPLQLLALPFGQHRDQIFFPKSFFYTLVMWRALKSCYGQLPRGREGYRTIWRKKKFLGKFFPKASKTEDVSKGDHCSFWHIPLDSTEDKFFFQSLSFIP